MSWYEWPTQKRIEHSWVYSALSAIRKPEAPSVYELRNSEFRRFKDFSDRALIEAINLKFTANRNIVDPFVLNANEKPERPPIIDPWLVTPGEKLARQCQEKLREINQNYQKEIESLGIVHLKIIGIAFMAWIIPSGIVYLLGFSIGWIYRGFKENKTSTKMPSKSKRLFKNTRVGIILILVGIFIPMLFFPRYYRHAPLPIPYQYFILIGIILVFTGVGIITGFLQSAFFYFLHGNMTRKIGGRYRIGIIFIFVGFFVPSVMYPMTEHPSLIGFSGKNLRQGESVIVLKRGEQIINVKTGRVLGYKDGTYLYYKHILAGGIILVFLGIGIITINTRMWKQKDA